MTLRRAVIGALTLVVGTTVIGPAVQGEDEAATAAHTVVVTGAGVTTYPAFSAATARYAIRTTDATAGSVIVDATTTDPDGRAFVNGSLATGPVQVTGLDTGDEVSVIMRDDSGTSAYSYVYLPSTFPALHGDGSPSSTGETLMTLNPFGNEPPRFMTAVDGNGVPTLVLPYTGNRHDFKALRDGTFSVSQDVPGPAGNVILTLDSQLREIAQRSTVGLVNTDFHDSLLLDNGNRVLIAYEPRGDGSGLTDAAFEEIDPAGQVVFDWNSKDAIDLAAEAVSPSGDYAHLNSVQVMHDGDYLVSLRHLSVVLKIARTDHDGYAAGDVVWRLGGRLSDFDLTVDPLFGPCAQHTASDVTQPGGPTTIMVFDNGSGDNNPLCVDPANPSGPRVSRPQSRAVEFVLDEAAGEVTVGRSYARPGRFAPFAGSAERLSNGHTLIGWTNHPDAIATEVDPNFNPIWEMSSENGYGSYRVHRGEIPDTGDPTVAVSVPAEGATYEFGQQVVADYSCTDRGGSGLSDCVGTAEEGTLLNTTTPGEHTFTLAARDGDGNTSSLTRTYTVLPAPTPTPEPTASPTPSPTTNPTTPTTNPTTPTTNPTTPTTPTSNPTTSPTTTPTTTSTPDPTPSPTLTSPTGSTTTPEPTPEPTVRPDISLVLGDRVIDKDAYGRAQRGWIRLTPRRPARVVRLRIHNDGDLSAPFTVAVTGLGRAPSVTASLGKRDVTRALARGRLRIAALAPGEGRTVRVIVRHRDVDGALERRTLRFWATSMGRTDGVRLSVRAE